MLAHPGNVQKHGALDTKGANFSFSLDDWEYIYICAGDYSVLVQYDLNLWKLPIILLQPRQMTTSLFFHVVMWASGYWILAHICSLTDFIYISSTIHLQSSFSAVFLSAVKYIKYFVVLEHFQVQPHIFLKKPFIFYSRVCYTLLQIHRPTSARFPVWNLFVVKFSNKYWTFMQLDDCLWARFFMSSASY